MLSLGRMRKISAHPIRPKLLLACISSLLGLYGLESLLEIAERLRPPRDQRAAQAAAGAGKAYDRRSPLDVIMALRKAGRMAYPLFSPTYVLRGELPAHPEGLLPLAALSRSLHILCNEGGNYALFDSDEHGFNNPPGLYQPSPKLVLLGDSFVEGACVAPEDTIAAVIRMQGPRALSLGRGGYRGPLLMLATFREYVEPLEPAVIVWFFYGGNDFDDLAFEAQHEPLLRYLKQDYSQRLLDRQGEIDAYLRPMLEKRIADSRASSPESERPGRLLWKMLRLQNLRGKLNLGRGKLLFPSSRHRQARIEELLRQVLSVAARSAKRWNGRLVFVYLPSWEELNEKRSLLDALAGRTNARPAVLDIARGLGFGILDMTPVFAASRDWRAMFPYGLPSHYNERGYAIIGAEVVRYLDSRRR